jgi:hypothetical protein
MSRTVPATFHRNFSGNPDFPYSLLSKRGKQKIKKGLPVDTSSYGRKESEGKDFNEDTNFGKLKRIPHPKLQTFLAKHRLNLALKESLELPEAIEEVGETRKRLEES